MHWFQKDQGKRLANDQKVIAASFPDLQYYQDEQLGTIYLEGSLKITSESGISTSIAVRIDFPENYPTEEPIVIDINNRFQHIPDRHFYQNGQCCLWLPPLSQWQRKTPNALKYFLDEVVVFFDKQLLYDITGKWPGPAWKHGDNGYLEYIEGLLRINREQLVLLTPVILNLKDIGKNTRCPCGSNRKFKKCHIYSVRELYGKMSKTRILEVLKNLK